MDFYFDDHRTELHKSDLSDDWTNMSCPKTSASVLALVRLYVMFPCILNTVRYGPTVQTIGIRG